MLSSTSPIAGWVVEWDPLSRSPGPGLANQAEGQVQSSGGGGGSNKQRHQEGWFKITYFSARDL